MFAGTKDESPLGDFEQALIEVAGLYKEAKELESDKRKEKAEGATDSKAGSFMQNEAVKKKYGGMSAEELKARALPWALHHALQAACAATCLLLSVLHAGC